MLKIVKESLVVEDGMGGVSATMSTVLNTPGVGNATPAGLAATTGAQMSSPKSTGSGDRFDNDTAKKKKKKRTTKGPFGKPATQAAQPKTKKLKEENISPYDKIGMAMAKKMKIKPPFKKKDSRTNTTTQRKFESQTYSIMTLDDFSNRLLEEEKKDTENTSDKESLKYVKGKDELKKIGIAFVYKMIDDKHQIAFIKDDTETVEQKLKEDGWKKGESKTEKTCKIDEYTKEDETLSVFTGEFDHPYVTLVSSKKE
jgi:hypothetical protein